MQAPTPAYGVAGLLQAHHQWQAFFAEQLRQQQQQYAAAATIGARYAPYAPPATVYHTGGNDALGADAGQRSADTGATSSASPLTGAGGSASTGTTGGSTPASATAPAPSKYRRHPKPPYSYIHLIAMAIRDSATQRATLAEINEYLMGKFPFFQGEYQGWKNSIRHNLSLNDCFVKVLRDPTRPWAKDNYWTLNADSEYTFADGVFRRRRKRVASPPTQQLQQAADSAAQLACRSPAVHVHQQHNVLAAHSHSSKLFVSPSASSDLGASFGASAPSPNQSSLCSNTTGGSGAAMATAADLSANCRRFAIDSLLDASGARPDSGLCVSPAHSAQFGVGGEQ